MASPPSPPFGMPPSLPSPPGDPPSPPPIELLIADVVSWFWLSVLFAMIVISVVLRAASGRSLSAKRAGGFRVRVRGAFSRYAEQCMSWFPRSRDSAAGLLRAVAVGLLRVLAALFLVSAGLVFYGEARFSVTTSYSMLARSKEPRASSTAHYCGRLGRTASGLGCSTYSGGAPQPLRPSIVRPSARAKVADVTALIDRPHRRGGGPQHLRLGVERTRQGYATHGSNPRLAGLNSHVCTSPWTATKSARHYGMWGWAALAFALAGAALSAAELLSREHPRPAPAPPGPQRLRKVRWHLGNSKASLALMLVFAGTAAIVAGKTIDPNPNPNPVPNPTPDPSQARASTGRTSTAGAPAGARPTTPWRSPAARASLC